MKSFDYLIVGAGLYGATYAHLAHRQGKKCLVIDRRQHLGGNIYCEKIEGINVHKYGAHIFHTNNKKVWEFVKSIVDFNRFTNSPIARYKDKLFNLPFNMNTFHEIWPDVFTPEQARLRIDEQCTAAILRMKADGAMEPRNLEEQAKVLIGEDIYHALIEGYTEKQWGRKCCYLPAFIIRRLPIRFTFDNNYFNAKYQGIPEGGYNRLIDGLLDGIETRTGVDYIQNRYELNAMASKVVYTGALDELFDFCDGKLQYRTVYFETEVLDIPNYQGNAVVNFTDSSIPYTRIIEHKHFEMFGNAVDACPKTVISREYSEEWKPGMEPYYPVNDAQNTTLYERYSNRARQVPNFHFGGRLADFAYYDMDKTIEQVMHAFNLEH
jgi:UDP-galactopyranose mutase